MKQINFLLKKHAVCIFIITLLFCQFNSNAQALDSKGTDFWLTFTRNYDNQATATLFITGEQNTTGTVSMPGIGYSTTFSVTAGAITSVVLPATAFVTTENVVLNNGIHITSQNEVTVYGLNREQYTTDAFLGLPTDILGTEYINLGYTANSFASEFGVVATQNSTTVTITPKVTASGHPANVPYNIVLNQGQTYMIGSTSGDLSGSIITSTQPIAVFGGHQCANIPPGYGACDYVVEELPPVTAWGKNFVTVPLKTRLKGDTFRFLASTNGTSISVNGVVVAVLNRGAYFETILTAASQVTATQPILVAQYSNGSGYDGVTSDPFMMLIPPYEQFLGNYTITTPASGFSNNFINLVAPTSAVGTIKLDGAIIPSSSFSPIGSSGFSGAQIDITLNAHTLKSATLPFGVFVYGFADYDSYGYPGGQSLSPIATVTSVTLTPKTGTASVNTNQCFDALVKDQFNNPVVGVRVDFNITGANPGSTGFANTNASGIAHFCYIGTNMGTDNIAASVGTISDAGFFVWVAGAPVTDYYSKPAGDLHNVLTWGVNMDGSGANPPDFGAGKTFHLVNRVPTYTMTADWTVGGTIDVPAGSRLQINGFTLSEAQLMGTGTLYGSTTSSLIVTGTTGGDSGPLNFASGGTSLNNLTLNRTGASATAMVGTMLDIYGVLTVTNGTLNSGNNITLKSNVVNTARVAPVTGSISGNVTVERYIPARRAWRLLAAPIAGSQSINAAWQEGTTTFSVNPNPAPGFGTHITQSVSNGADGLDFNTAIAMSSLKMYQNTNNTWVPVLNTNTTPVNGNAWFIFVRGDRSINMGYNTVAPNNTVLRSMGPLKTGDQTFPINATGLTAIPNPYASPLNFATIAANNPNINNSFTVVDPKLGSTGAFVNVSYNGSSYDVTPAAASPINELIQSGQGFLVQSKGVGGSITIRESDKSATAATNVFRVGANTSAGLRVNLQTFTNDTAVVLDEAYSSYSDKFSNKVDEMDALKAGNQEENLAIITDEQSLMVDRRKPLQENDVIKLKLWNLAQQNYILSFNPVNLTTIPAFVIDNYLKTSTSIDLNKETKISFMVNSDDASKNPYRFQLVFSDKANPYSSITAGEEIRVAPNPIQNKLLNIQLTSPLKGNYQIQLIDNVGRNVYQTTLVHPGGFANYSLHLNSATSQGLYQLKVSQGTTVKTIKVLIN